MPNHLKFACNCERCRRGRHSKTSKVLTQRKIKGFKRKAEMLARYGLDEFIPKAIVNLPFTD